MEKISKETTEKMNEFIKKNDGKSLTLEEKKEGRKIISQFIDESCKSYETTAEKIKEVILKERQEDTGSFSCEKIKKIIDSYKIDEESHKLFENVLKIVYGC